MPSYTPSRLLDGEAGLLREHAFTRWMSRDLLQATTDFSKNIGLIAIYAETNKEGQGRYLFWHAPEGWGCEIRSGRTLDQFAEFDRRNTERGWPLLTLDLLSRLARAEPSAIGHQGSRRLRHHARGKNGLSTLCPFVGRRWF